jgi:cytochrome P450 family 3 subfamily A
LSPKLATYLAKKKWVEFFPMKPLKFLENVTNAIIDRRKAKLDVRDDFIQSMIEKEQSEPKGHDVKDEKENDEQTKIWSGKLKNTLTKSEILAQAIVFLAAGYETTATTLEFISYNLATNQDVQDILIDEVDQVLDKHVSL